MKKLILMACLFASTISYCQKLTEDRIDDFTNYKIKRTSWERLAVNMQFSAYFRISKIDTLVFFDIKMMKNDRVFSIGKNDELMMKLNNDSVATLLNVEFTITCSGCGSVGIGGINGQGLQVSYPINLRELDLLTQYRVNKIRIYTSDGYVEDNISSSTATKIISALKLIG